MHSMTVTSHQTPVSPTQLIISFKPLDKWLYSDVIHFPFTQRGNKARACIVLCFLLSLSYEVITFCLYQALCSHTQSLSTNLNLECECYPSPFLTAGTLKLPFPAVGCFVPDRAYKAIWSNLCNFISRVILMEGDNPEILIKWNNSKRALNLHF